VAHIYHWKHGWIPLDHTAALSKAKGNHAAAARMLGDAHDGTAGMHSRQDVAKALVSLPDVPAADRPDAHAQIAEAAARHNSTDLLPTSRPGAAHEARAADLRARADAKRAEAERIANGVGVGDSAAGRLNARTLAQFHRNTDSSLRRYTEAHNAAESLDMSARVAEAKATEASRQHFTKQELDGATLVHDGYGWHEVVRVNGKTVTVKTPYSWTETIAHGKIRAVAKPHPTEPGKSVIRKPGSSAA
jgi:hypothetical protein